MSPDNPAGDGRPFGIGVIGCGNISKQYLQNLTSFPDVQVVICADIDPTRAKAQAAAYGVPEWGSAADALGHPDVQLIVNLTIPVAHAEVTAAAIAAGKHVWSEKPLTLDVAAGRALLSQADAAGVRVGCAPDTVLGAGLQTARRLIDSGRHRHAADARSPCCRARARSRGTRTRSSCSRRARARCSTSGRTTCPCSRRCSARRGRSPPSGAGRASPASSAPGPRAGTAFDVAVPTYVAALAEYVGGQAASLLFSWDSPLSRSGFVEITGTEATLAVPDPNRFDGDIRVRRAGDDDWTVIPAEGAAAGRGIGVVDMVRAIRAGAPHRASGEMALHVLEMMTAIERSAVSAAFEPVESRFDGAGAARHTMGPLCRSALTAGRHRRRHGRLRVHGPGPLAGLERRGPRVRPPAAATARRHLRPRQGGGRGGRGALGWAAAETDWRALIARDDVQLVDIAARATCTRRVAIAALAAGKHVLCEKPLANTLAEAEAMEAAADAAYARGARAMVGFNYRRVPALALARRLVEQGRIGPLRHFRAVYLQDWLADADAPMTWRMQAERAGSGALGDLGAHIVDLARYLTGDEIAGVSARQRDLRRASGRWPRRRPGSVARSPWTTRWSSPAGSPPARWPPSRPPGTRPGARTGCGSS